MRKIDELSPAELRYLGRHLLAQTAITLLLIPLVLWAFASHGPEWGRWFAFAWATGALWVLWYKVRPVIHFCHKKGWNR